MKRPTGRVKLHRTATPRGGLDYATVSVAVKRFAPRLAADRPLATLACRKILKHCGLWKEPRGFGCELSVESNWQGCFRLFMQRLRPHFDPAMQNNNCRRTFSTDAPLFRWFASRCARNGIAVILSVLLPAVSAVADYPPPPLPSPTNNDPANQIRFSTPAGADARRQQLIHYIWPGGLPTNVPATVTTNVAFASGLQSYVSRIDLLDTKVMGMDNVAYLITPKGINANADRLVISFGGHNTPQSPLGSRPYDMADSARDPVPSLLRAGFSVLRIQMPLCSWNGNYTTLTPPGMGTVTLTTKGSSGHNELFQKVAPALGGRTFQFFLQPVVEGINYFKGVHPDTKDVSMFGLSGGGWATSMAAAIDTRIKQSASGSGSWPLYIRNAGFGRGDAEQVYSPLYREDIAPDGSGGGIATWLEIYALGGYGHGRSQVMWSNLGEPNSLFGGTHADRFKGIVSDKVTSLGAGKWEYVYDTTGGTGASAHTITPWAVNHIILPAILNTNPTNAASRLRIIGWSRPELPATTSR